MNIGSIRINMACAKGGTRSRKFCSSLRFSRSPPVTQSSRVPPPFDGRGWGRVVVSFCLMASITPSIFPRTSLFQNLRTWKPWLPSHASRSSSLCFSRACWPPSTSITSRASKHAKSTIKGPGTCWRRNLTPHNCLFLRCRHRTFSASVDRRLRSLAMGVSLVLFEESSSHPPLAPPVKGGESG
jgi:hypothetical protein